MARVLPTTGLVSVIGVIILGVISIIEGYTGLAYTAFLILGAGIGIPIGRWTNSVRVTNGNTVSRENNTPGQIKK
jgi:type IV secretory pathway VirB2 component (pilin)